MCWLRFQTLCFAKKLFLLQPEPMQSFSAPPNLSSVSNQSHLNIPDWRWMEEMPGWPLGGSPTSAFAATLPPTSMISESSSIDHCLKGDASPPLPWLFSPAIPMIHCQPLAGPLCSSFIDHPIPPGRAGVSISIFSNIKALSPRQSSSACGEFFLLLLAAISNKAGTMASYRHKGMQNYTPLVNCNLGGLGPPPPHPPPAPRESRFLSVRQGDHLLFRCALFLGKQKSKGDRKPTAPPGRGGTPPNPHSPGSRQMGKLTLRAQAKLGGIFPSRRFKNPRLPAPRKPHSPETVSMELFPALVVLNSRGLVLKSNSPLLSAWKANGSQLC